MIDYSKISTLLNEWYKTPLGQRLVEAEQKELNAILPRLYGYHLLQLGTSRQTEWPVESPILHRMSVGLYDDHPSFCSEFTELPFSDESLDVVLLPHVLEWVDDSERVLQEAWRTVIGEGHLIILVFNRWSLWGLYRLLKFCCAQIPWNGHFFSLRKIRRLLLALGCEITHQKSLFYNFPAQCPQFLKKFQWMEKLGKRLWPKVGAVNIVVVRKKLITLTPIKSNWNPTKALVAKGLEPTIRGLKSETSND